MARAGTWSTCFMYLSPGLGFSAARWLRHSSFNDANSFFQYSSVPLLIRVRLFATPWTAALQASLSIINSWSLLKHVSNWVSDAIQPSHPLSSPSPAVNLSQHQGLFTGVSSSIRWLKSKVLEFQLQHQWSWMNIQHPMNIQDWFPLVWTGWISLQSKGLSRVFSNTTVQKPSTLWCLAFFIVQLSHPYITTGKTIAFTRGTFVANNVSSF